MKDYILGSHNSWSFLKPKHWWMRPFAFISRCQHIDITQQYALGVRCFDLRILFDDKGNFKVAHGYMVYDITQTELVEDLQWLNAKGNCYVRLIHEVRRKSQYTDEAIQYFKNLCHCWESTFKNIHFWCGRNLYNWQFDYDFGPEPSCEEKYASVCPPKWLDDWWPWIYARFHNHDIYANGTDKEILLIDFVDIK